MERNLTKGPIAKTLLAFAFPMMLGNLLQQFYNVADTFIVGRFLGADALAAVGSSYTLMTCLTSIILGLCMGSGAVFSLRYGAGEMDRLKNRMILSFLMIAVITIGLNILVFVWLDPILQLMQVPKEVLPMMSRYLQVIFAGITATFLYNYFASLLRAVGNSRVPLLFLGISAVLNIVLDLFFILNLGYGVEGAALATIIAQYFSGIGILVYTLLKCPRLRPSKKHFYWEKEAAAEIAQFSFMTCIQQSIMNFGILMIQGLVNSFGAVIMAAFAAAVKIDSFAYMPVQDFGNAYSTFIAQNYGAGEKERIRKGTRLSVLLVVLFCLIITAAVCIFARPLMLIFVDPGETQILAAGVQYLRIEGACYCGIGCLFLLYGLYRAVRKPGMSVILTVISLGTRVALAYILAPIPWIGVVGIWISVPIGWLLADVTGFLYYRRNKEKML